MWSQFVECESTFGVLFHSRVDKGGGQSTRDTRLPTVGGRERSNPGQGCGMSRASGAEVSSRERLSPRLNLRGSTRVGAWNVMFLSEVRDECTRQRDCHLPQLSTELSRFGVSDAALSEVRKPGSGWVSGSLYTYYWSGRPHGRRSGCGRRRPTGPYSYGGHTCQGAYHETENPPYTGCDFSGLCVCSDRGKWKKRYAQLQMVVVSCPKGDTLIVLGDLNATTGTDRDGCESCVGPYGFGSKD